ncbi:MAG: prolipoprotein diacylglyceryl transferase [Fusobacteriaceae bacterium]
MNPIFLQIGGIKIYYYGLMYAVAFFLGVELAKRYGKKKNIEPSIVENFAFVAMISGLIGGRIYYVLFNLPFYLSNPTEIYAVWHGGMAIHGGIIGGIIGTLINSKIKKINPLELADIMAPSVLLGQAIGRIGNFMNGEIHGVPTFTPWSIIFSLKPKFQEWYASYQQLSIDAQTKFGELVPWGLTFPTSSPAGSEFPNLPLHPAMLYELFLNLAGFCYLWFFLSKKKVSHGTIALVYIIIYSVNRIIVSFFRAEDLMMGGLRAPHVVSLISIIFCVVAIKFLNKKNKNFK